MNIHVQHTTVTVFEGYEYALDRSDWPPVDASDFVVWMCEKFAAIPSEFRDAAKIQINSNERDGAVFRIYYARPETPEEAAAKEARARQILQDEEARERALLTALLKKYKS